MAKIKAIRKPPILALPPIDYSEAASLKALHAGTATPHQQQIALTWIIKHAAMSKSLAFDPDNARASDFNMGRQFVAHAIVWAIEEPMSGFQKQNN